MFISKDRLEQINRDLTEALRYIRHVDSGGMILKVCNLTKGLRLANERIDELESKLNTILEQGALYAAVANVQEELRKFSKTKCDDK